MADVTRADVEAALHRIISARTDYLDAYQIPLKVDIPPPANESDVASVESHAGRRLPPSYRNFLLVQNGFTKIDGNTNVKSTEEMLAVTERQRAAIIRKVSAEYDYANIGNCIPFAWSGDLYTVYLFDPHKNDDGEFGVIFYEERHDTQVFSNLMSLLNWIADAAQAAADDARS